jgi:hypothetical protein
MPLFMTAAAIGLSVIALVLTAAMKATIPAMAYAHFAIAAAAALTLTMIAIRETKQLIADHASPSALAASQASHLGLVWTWGALAIAVTYGTQVLSWREWLSFLIAFIVAAGLCLFFSATLKKDAAENKIDATLLKLARALSIAQLVAMLAVVAGLLIDGKMTRFLTPRYTDWAANNIFFCGAVAVAAICAYALKTIPKPSA